MILIRYIRYTYPLPHSLLLEDGQVFVTDDLIIVNLLDKPIPSTDVPPERLYAVTA